MTQPRGWALATIERVETFAKQIVLDQNVANHFLKSLGNRMTHEHEKALDDDTKENIAQSLWMTKYREKDIPNPLLEKIKSGKNSNFSFAVRLKTHLQKLLDEKLSYVEPRVSRYQVMMEHAHYRSPQQCYANMLFMGPESVLGYKAIPNKPQFQWPQIDHPQWQNQVGWHFFVGNFRDANGNHYSIQLMFWQYAQLPPSLAANLGLSDIENQTVELHLAISDQTNDIHYRANTVIVAGTTGLIDFQNQPYSYTQGKNSIESLNGSDNLFPVRLKGRGWDMGKKPKAEIEIDLSLDNKKGYFLEGDGGCAPSIDGIGTLYYSAAQLVLAAGRESLIKINGNTILLTDGSMWFDHQWGTGFMPNGAPHHAVMRASQNLSEPPPGGWDWFMFHFHQNQALSSHGQVQMTFSALHTNQNKAFYWQTGEQAPGTMTAAFSGKYIDADNQASDLKGIMQVTKWAKASASPNPKIYPPTHTWYPSEYHFKVDTGDLPPLLREFTAKPIVSCVQSGFFANGLQYMEGGIMITDVDGNEIGRGFAEGTNYADSTSAVVSLAGLPVNPETLTFLKAPKITFWLKALSYLCVLIRAKKLKRIISEARGL